MQNSSRNPEFEKSLQADTHFVPFQSSNPSTNFQASLPAVSHKIQHDLGTTNNASYLRDMHLYVKHYLKKHHQIDVDDNTKDNNLAKQSALHQMENGSINEFLQMQETLKAQKWKKPYNPVAIQQRPKTEAIEEHIVDEQEQERARLMLSSLDHQTIRNLLKQESITLLKEMTEKEVQDSSLSTVSSQHEQEWGNAHSIIRGLESLLK